MAINLRTPQAETRDQRLGTITQWQGSARQLAQDSTFTYACGRDCGPGGRRLCELSSPYSQASMCAEQIAVTNATIIKDTVVIQHSPIGCASSQSFTSRYSRDLAARRGWKPEDPKSICTNLSEQDMVFGGVDRLAQTIREAYARHHPRVIFVATSCATGIIGDDVDGTARQLEEEIGIPVVALHCEGFKSRHWSSGWDVIEHGILRRLVPNRPTEKRGDLINVIHLGGPDVFSPLLNPIGLKVNLVMGGNSLERLADLSTAAATVTMCFVLSYLATGLEQEYGVPEIRAPLPYGLDATDAWLRDIARLTQREHLVEAVIAAERERIAPELKRLRGLLAGKRGFVAAGAAFAHGLIADLRELGITVDDAFSFHHDPTTDSGDAEQDSLGHLVQSTGDVPNFTVSPDQHFQAHAAILRAKPDFVICRHSGSMAILAGRMGIPVLPIFYSNDGLGYEGLITIGRAILRVLPRRRFYAQIAEHSRFPYQDWWLNETDPYALSAEAAE
ncbi:MAG: nitrogenase component 1 [Ancalomicrobiaceae bacterium]|nr:nitrogenase component 1 [Ancalomicrobiaceae bacterium]